jgi:hypothetical protein
VLPFGGIRNAPPTSFIPLHIFGNYNHPIKGGDEKTHSHETEVNKIVATQ